MAPLWLPAAILAFAPTILGLNPMDSRFLYGLVLTFPPVVLSLTIHEFAHARTALAFGDSTAKEMGRCTLNPLAHLDPIGTIALLLAPIGWAKPVPVNPNYLHPPRLGNVAVSAAGPFSNLVLAAMCAAVLRVLARFGLIVNPEAAFVPGDLAAFLLVFTLVVNVSLFIFNLIPLFPLDGHHIGRETVGPRLREGYMRWQHHYGSWVLMGLIFAPMLLRGTSLYWLNPLGWYLRGVLWPMVDWLLGPEALSMGFSAIDKFSRFVAWF